MKRMVLTAVALAMAAFAWGTGAAQGGLQTVRLAIGYIPHVQFTPLYVGVDKGFYKDEGIDLQLSFGFQYDVFSLLAAGKIDVGLSDSDQLIIAGAKGMGLQAIFQYYQQYPITIVARAGISAPADLAGKTVGTPELSGSAWIGLQLFLKKYGLEKDVTVQKIGYTQEATLMAGRADAVVCFYNNEPVLLRSKGVAFQEWDVKDLSDMVGASFISSRAIISSRTDTLARFVRATRKAMAWTVDNRDEAEQIAMKNVGNVLPADEPLFRERLDATVALFGGPQAYGALDAGRYTRSIAELAALGLIPQAYPTDTILHSF